MISETGAVHANQQRGVHHLPHLLRKRVLLWTKFKKLTQTMMSANAKQRDDECTSTRGKACRRPSSTSSSFNTNRVDLRNNCEQERGDETMNTGVRCNVRQQHAAFQLKLCSDLQWFRCASLLPVQFAPYYDNVLVFVKKKHEHKYWK